jgi:HlyD family secretion protein
MRWALIAAGAIAVILLLRATVFRSKPIEVEVVRVSRGVVEDAVTNSQAGTVKSRYRARVGAERAGRVVAIPHREGAVVKKGEPLLLLDASSARVQLDLAQRDLETARATVESARAAAQLAGRDFERTEQLRAAKLVAQEQMDQVKSRRDAADADLAAAEARAQRAASAVRLARDELDHMTVKAPFDGVVSQRLVEVGESVIPGQPVIEVVNLDRLYVSAPIDEVDIGRLKEKLPARVSLDPYPGQVWRGSVTRVFPVVNDVREQNRTLEVEVDLVPDPKRPRPKPGTSADVEIIINRRPDVLRVPTYAVIEGKRVLVVTGGKAVSRNVVVGLKNWEWAEIREGLKEGEWVVTSLDKQGVKAGVRVRPRERPAEAVPARASRSGVAGGSAP